MAQAQPEDFRIDVAHEQSFRYLQAKQYDHNSRIRRLIITDNNIPIIFTGKELIDLSLYIDGQNFSNTICPFDDDGYPYITFTEAMLSRKGDVSCEIRIYDSAKASVITTFTFMMTISGSLLNQDRLVKSSEFNILNDLILQANTIPDILKDFQLSYAEITGLINQIKTNITNYANQFLEIKTQYTKDFTSLIQQINADITNYQSNYNSLKSEFISFKDGVVTWHTDAQASENTRKQNETARQTNAATAIKNCETAVNNTNQVIRTANETISSANNAGNYALSKGTYAEEQANRAEQALQDFEFRLRTIDGGGLIDTTPAEGLYDGGTL